MIRAEKTLDQYIRLEELHEMEEFVPMTLPERNRLRNWVYRGHSVNQNPWHYKDGNGYDLNYLDGYHRHLAEMWGDFYRPFYRVIKTEQQIYEEDGNELYF